MASARENILKKIKQALAQPVPVPFPHSNGGDIFYPPQKDLAVEFAENFSGLMGKFSFCDSELDLAHQLAAFVESRPNMQLYCNEMELLAKFQRNGFTPGWTTDLDACSAAITSCEALVARTGSLLLSSASTSGRTVSVYAPIHICIAYSSQLVYDISDGMQLIHSKYGKDMPSMISLATGPSRTADIEKTLVVGVHGPREVYVFLVED